MGASGKKVVLVIAHENFRDEELAEPMEVLESAGVEVTIASSSLEPAKGKLGAVVLPDILIDDIRVGDFDAIVFIGGGGSSEYFESPVAHNIARDAAPSGKLIGAICVAPSILANAGLLEGKKATSYPSEEQNLKSKGASFTGAGVEVDGRIITADGPKSAREFGRALLDALK
ncbi:DJ-1/PfpI family protein [archaeon]|nr:DJ-1/PfpI family protein [archaeon]